MYRLPSQFDPAARHDGMSAAGGGSTSTTCSSCVVTLGAASVLTASLFAARVPGVVASPDATAVELEEPVSADSAASPPVTEPLIDAQSRPVIARGGLIVLGLFALPIAIVAALMAGVMEPGFGAIVGIAVFIGIYCWAYERSGRSVGRGAAIAIAMLVGIVLASAAEMAVWLSAMG